MASTYYVKKNGKFPRALFAEHTGKANFVFHMPDGVMAVKESHSCLRSIQAGNWKVITKEEALALKEKKVSYPRYITGMWTCGSKFIKIISSTKAVLIDKDGKESDYGVAAALDGLKNNKWWEISETEALAKLENFPKYVTCKTWSDGTAYVKLTDKDNAVLVTYYGEELKHSDVPRVRRMIDEGKWKVISKEEAEKLVAKPESTNTKFNVSGAGVYLTAGGYLIELDKNLCAAGKYSPGLTIHNNCCEQSNKYGWIWRVDGAIIGLQPEWCEKLRLVEKMPEGFIIPPETEIFKYLDGYPIVRRPNKGEYNIPLYKIKAGQYDTDKLCTMALCLGDDHNTRALIFTGKQQAPKESEQMAYPITQSGQYELMNGQIVNLTLSARKDIASCSIKDKVKSDSGHASEWYWNQDGTIGGLGTYEYCKALYVKRFIGPLKESVTTVGTENQKVTTGEEEMKKETAVVVAKTVGNLALRAVNYWAWEPAKNIGGRVLSSVRYVAFFTGITACVLGYNYPEQTKALVKSALPKVHISVERPDLLK